MENYIDNSFVIVQNTIITYCGLGMNVKVPKRMADMEISRIGDGSFMESVNLQCVTVPPGIREIGSRAFSNCSALTSVYVPGDLTEVGKNAFSDCDSLSEITVYDLELTASEYFTLKNAAKRSDGDIYVTCEMPKHKLVHKIVSSIPGTKPACRIPSDIPLLFCMAKLDEQEGRVSLHKNIPVIGFSVPSVPTSENQAFCNRVKNAEPEAYDGKSDRKNDWYVRIGKTPFTGRTILFTFDDTKTKEEKGKYFIHATLKIGYFFWQSAQTVMCNHQKYSIYRRFYLSFDQELEYVRRDIALYTDAGLVNDREEAMTVYAKYKLLSIF